MNSFEKSTRGVCEKVGAGSVLTCFRPSIAAGMPVGFNALALTHAVAGGRISQYAALTLQQYLFECATDRVDMLSDISPYGPCQVLTGPVAAVGAPLGLGRLQLSG